jgi:hypothetical protein
MKKLILSLIIMSIACATQAQNTPKNTKKQPDTPLETLQKQMKGTFTSATQAQADTSYFDITLNMHPIWKKNDDKIKWLYVEQAMTAKLEKPYRQRIYRLTQINENTFESAVFELPTPDKYIGAWKIKDAFDALTPDKLITREGCQVVLNLDKQGNYIGKTGDKSCTSTLRGASYATSQVSIFEDKIVSWDQGFDANAKQVWGATKGGYQFIKIKNKQENKDKSKDQNIDKKDAKKSKKTK